MLPPIVLFTYLKLDTLHQTVCSLLANPQSNEYDLIVFSDAPRHPNDAKDVEKVREYIKAINGFKSVQLNIQHQNKGLAKSIIQGVSQVLEEHASVIVVEDDLQVSTNFLSFMTKGLKAYAETEQVLAVCGYTTPMGNHSIDVFFSRRFSSWGWATWQSRWQKINWNIYQTEYPLTKLKISSTIGSDISRMLNLQLKGMLNSWAVRMVYHQANNDLVTVHPMVSKVNNIGLEAQFAQNTTRYANRFHTLLDTSNQQEFHFYGYNSIDVELERTYLIPFSLKRRVFDRLHHLFR